MCLLLKHRRIFYATVYICVRVCSPKSVVGYNPSTLDFFIDIATVCLQAVYCGRSKRFNDQLSSVCLHLFLFVLVCPGIHPPGRQIKYLPLCLAMGICPDEPRSFFLQQYRWCMGTCTLVLEGEFWRSSISKMHKMCFVNGLFYYTQTALVSFFF